MYIHGRPFCTFHRDRENALFCLALILWQLVLFFICNVFVYIQYNTTVYVETHDMNFKLCVVRLMAHGDL